MGRTHYLNSPSLWLLSGVLPANAGPYGGRSTCASDECARRYRLRRDPASYIVGIVYWASDGVWSGQRAVTVLSRV